jgi:hypothetical protein
VRHGLVLTNNGNKSVRNNIDDVYNKYMQDISINQPTAPKHNR